ncbi:MAG: 6-bladed beta-propeller, partial [Prevotellaceae bacterium]|nr:6-bladed beta-propeller [Prevotellaceae bacterium]
MKKKKKLVIITILNVCVLFSCKNNVKEPTSGNYIVDYNNSKPMMPDEIRYKLEYILLSTEQEQSLFSLGNKFSLINNKIYVLDEIKAKNVLVFKDNGEFERQ